MKKFILLGTITAICTIGLSNSHATELSINDCQASLVFDTALGERSTIMLKTLSNGQWSGITAVFESTKDIAFNPIVASDQQNNTLVVWPSLEKGTTRIKYRVQLPDGRWESDASRLTSASGESTSPSILSNLANDIWLAWASDTNGLDDIFIARWSNGVWSVPKQVNQVNQVPDITPSLSRLEGNIILTWRSYDQSVKKYLSQSKTIASYTPPAENSTIVSDFCRDADYLSNFSAINANWIFLDKTRVISNHSETIKNQ